MAEGTAEVRVPPLEALIEVDASDRVVTWSREAEKLTGYRRAQAIGRGFCELLDARDLWGNRASNLGLHEGLRRSEPLSTFLLQARTAAGDSVRLVIVPVACTRRDRPGLALAYRVRLDRRRRVDRRSTSLAAELFAARGPGANRTVAPLSRREAEVLRLLAAGASTAGVSERLGISVVTVRNHVQRLLDRLGVHSRLEAVALARGNGWID
jgi:PAS domain S-box-containing protein